jgi:hypothetical protein
MGPLPQMLIGRFIAQSLLKFVVLAKRAASSWWKNEDDEKRTLRPEKPIRKQITEDGEESELKTHYTGHHEKWWQFKVPYRHLTTNSPRQTPFHYAISICRRTNQFS